MKAIILLLVVVLFPVYSFAETVSTEKSAPVQTLTEDKNEHAQFSTGLDKDAIIYQAGEGIDMEKADVCNQCTDPEVSSESNNAGP